MHDIRAIRENPAAFDAALSRRGLDALSAELLALDEARRAAIGGAEAALAARNAASKDVGKAKASGDEAEFERLRALVADKKDEIARLEAEAKETDEALTARLLEIPNLPDPDVPDGADESGNVELRSWGTPRDFGFAPKEHYEIPGVVPGMDFKTAAKMSGSRFVMLRGAVARIHRALAQFMLDTHIDKNGYTEINAPVLVTGKTINDAGIAQTPLGGTGQLPKFREDQYFVGSESDRAATFRRVVESFLDIKALRDAEGSKDVLRAFERAFEKAPTSEEFWLIPTSEVTLTNTVAETVLAEADLPRRMTAHSLCFRSEAGSAGRDTAGMLRQHQFEKVEMVSITHPDSSREELNRMTRCAEGILEALGLPYRTVVLCTGDMGFGARRTHDIEVWLPGQDTYREISSCSTTGDFQARRMNARFRPDARDGKPGKPEFVHTLNGSGLAVGRCLIAVLENGQTADGGVDLPEALGPWLGGRLRITPEGDLV